MLGKFAIHIHQLWAPTDITDLSWHTLTSIPRPLHLSTHIFRGSGYQVLSRNTSQHPRRFTSDAYFTLHKIVTRSDEAGMKVKVTQSCPTLCNLMDYTVHGILQARIRDWDIQYPLLHGIFPTQGLNPGLLHCRQILYQLSHQGSPRILEWVAYPFSRGSSQPSSWTRVF